MEVNPELTPLMDKLGLATSQEGLAVFRARLSFGARRRLGLIRLRSETYVKLD